MTAPAPVQQPPPPAAPAQPPPPEQPMSDAAIVAALAALLVSAAAAAVTSTLVAAIVALLVRPPERRGEVRVTRTAATAVARLVLQQRDRQVEPLGMAGRRMQRLNVQRRAQFLLAAARRVTRQIGTGRTREALVKALSAEQRFWRQHQEATAKRAQAAASTDSAIERHGVQTTSGTVLGWSAVNDDRTSAECRAAHGKNWVLQRPPQIGIPGTVHVHCRCKPVKPWPTKRLVGGGQLPETPR